MSTDHDHDPVEHPEDTETGLIDLDGVTLNELTSVDGSALGFVISRVLARHGDAADPVVAFQSSI